MPQQQQRGDKNDTPLDMLKWLYVSGQNGDNVRVRLPREKDAQTEETMATCGRDERARYPHADKLQGDVTSMNGPLFPQSSDIVLSIWGSSSSPLSGLRWPSRLAC